MGKEGRFKKVLNGYKPDEVNKYIEQMVDDYQNQVQSKEDEAHMLREQHEELLSAIKQLKDEKENYEETSKIELASLRNQFTSEEEKLKATINNLEFEKLQLEKQISQIEMTSVDDTQLEDMKEHYKTLIDEIESENAGLKVLLEETKHQLDTLELKQTENKEIFESRIKTYQNDIERLENELSQTISNMDSVSNQELEEMKYTLSSKEELVETLKLERIELLKQIEVMKEDADTDGFREEIERLQKVNLNYAEKHAELLDQLSNEKIKFESQKHELLEDIKVRNEAVEAENQILIEEHNKARKTFESQKLSMLDEISDLKSRLETSKAAKEQERMRLDEKSRSYESEKLNLKLRLDTLEAENESLHVKVEELSSNAETSYEIESLSQQFKDLKDYFEQSSSVYEAKISELIHDNKVMVQMMSQLNQEKTSLVEEKNRLAEEVDKHEQAQIASDKLLAEAKEKADAIVKRALKEAAIMQEDAKDRAKTIEKSALKKAMEAEINSEMMMERIKYKVQKEEDSYKMMLDDIQEIRNTVVSQLNKYQEELGSIINHVDSDADLIPLVKKYG
ncbi:hypothetical protein EZV73_11420 [Acidaminobacter sp. JC074]|uniref:hypothetical protein n=1 Tax=Acidaminobacter sp. JC074 TaxID=2530199 RepID=UPI001F109939|nr:hypothetical protein [Acidaminobacter sp. JC074]MCH4888187.1 hypothetical protein [Acidaminobacter sp. JC074]